MLCDKLQILNIVKRPSHLFAGRSLLPFQLQLSQGTAQLIKRQA